jgi:hypothetical protein
MRRGNRGNNYLRNSLDQEQQQLASAWTGVQESQGENCACLITNIPRGLGTDPKSHSLVPSLSAGEGAMQHSDWCNI